MEDTQLWLQKKVNQSIYIYILVIVALCLMHPASGMAADSDIPEVRLSLVQSLSEAKTLLERGRNEQAWELLSRVIREEPENVEANLLWVRAANRTGRINQALAALEGLVVSHPKDARLRRELAKAYARVGDRASFQSEMEIVKDLDPALSDKDDELALERTATARSKRWDRLQVAGRLAAGLTWNSNVNNGLDNREVTVGPLELRMTKDAEKQPALGQYVNGNVNAGWRLGDESPWWLVGDAAIYGNNYYRDVPSNQYFGWGRVAIGLRHVSAKNLFDLRIRHEHSFQEPEEYINSTGLDGTWVFAPLPNVQIITRGGVDARTYMENDNRDGNYWYAGSYLRLLWGGSRSNSVMVGARAIGAGTREDTYSYEGWEGLLRFNFTPIERLDIAPWVAYREQYYHDAATRLSYLLGEDNRFDQTYSAGVQLTWHWTENLATEVGWQYSKNNSNSDFYCYDQHQVNIGMAVNF